jgi:uncharacterized repeat protein (TIGR03803 family)
MQTTRINQLLKLAGFAPAGKLSNASQAPRRVAAVIRRISASWLAFGLVAIGAATAQGQTWSESVLVDFTNVSSKGANPYAGVIRDSAGNFFGTTTAGGASGYGTVYKLSATGQETVLYSFTGGPDGGLPYGGVIGDSAGILYGTTSESGSATGPYGPGVVYKVDPAGQETVLYTFTGGADGGYPYAGVISDSAGNLYGTTQGGGTADAAGVVFKLQPPAQSGGAWLETVLYSFTGGDDGAYPQAGVIRDPAGNLYGTTLYGGTAQAGVVFKLSVTGQETVLYSFTGGADGGYPASVVIRDSANNIYGTTQDGGATAGICSTYYYWGPGCGVVFKLNEAGTETVLYTFTGLADGAFPYAGVTPSGAGFLYGTASAGGTTAGTCGGFGGCGVVYKVDRAGTETVLHTFTGEPDGSSPESGLIVDSDGNLYGTSFNGGNSANLGAVYKLDAASEETVYAFAANIAKGTSPFGNGVIVDPAGDIYGATGGGTANDGLVYKLSPDGHETILHTFTGGADGVSPGGVIRGPGGTLYGTTGGGGTANAGVVYKLQPPAQAGGEWIETVLYSFTGGADGADPDAAPIIDSEGNLYGTTASGGAAGHGTVYKLSVAGQETVLYSFADGADGGDPAGGVIRDSATGNLYGTALFGGASLAGVVFKINPSGEETVLYNFTGGNDGSSPQSGVTADPEGNLYGTTYFGGTSNAGVVYKLAPSGQETVLCSFTGYPAGNGGYPFNGVIRDSAGNLYGTAAYGGSVGGGVVYEVDAAGNQTVLYNFMDEADGSRPIDRGSLALDSAGNLYGTTWQGGNDNAGLVFKLTPP